MINYLSKIFFDFKYVIWILLKTIALCLWGQRIIFLSERDFVNHTHVTTRTDSWC